MKQELIINDHGEWNRCKCSRLKRPSMNECFACEQYRKYKQNPNAYDFCTHCVYNGRDPIPTEKSRLDNGVCWDCSNDEFKAMETW